jgi:hypothetical protein
MKKLIVLLMIICLATCGCSKEETPAPEPVTEIPTQEITPTAIPTFNTACAVCGRQTDCKEIIRTRYDLDLQRDIDKAFYLCENCYGDALQDEKDLTVYHDLNMSLLIALTDEKYMNLNGTITIDEYGISASSGLEDLLKYVKDFFDTDDLKTSRDYTIEIKNHTTYSGNGPKSILDTLD